MIPTPSTTLADAIRAIAQAALSEDIGSGDITSQFFVEADRRGRARVFPKEPCVLSGVEVATRVFGLLDPSLEVTVHLEDGMEAASGDAVLTVAGSVRSLLSAERVALNFMQRLSGVATLTSRYVKAVSGTHARILDTRKTTPGMRLLEKNAVVHGGGLNHRIGLHDMVMVKDNHLATGITMEALQKAILEVKHAHPGVRVELEVDTLEQMAAFLKLREVDVILLDNMPLEQLREAVQLANGAVKLEASGGVTLATVAAIAATGVDFISVGALTHSAAAIDLSMELIEL
jgi:nicotinate-nucleotide pyrophosphorylase (carboxylating)